jgi:hypothetical protein
MRVQGPRTIYSFLHKVEFTSFEKNVSLLGIILADWHKFFLKFAIMMGQQVRAKLVTKYEFVKL